MVRDVVDDFVGFGMPFHYGLQIGCEFQVSGVLATLVRVCSTGPAADGTVAAGRQCALNDGAYLFD